MGTPARMQRMPVVRVLHWLAENLGVGVMELEASSESTSGPISEMEIKLETTDDTN